MGRRASKIELGAWKEPRPFATAVEAMRRLYGDHVLDQAGSVFRDAFVAARCATMLNAVAVRLGEDPPDFELKCGDVLVPCEVVEVMAPGRRRGVELQMDRGLPTEERTKARHFREDEWTSAAAALQQITDAVTAKVGKAYAAGTVLVVYLNVFPVAGEAALRRGLESAVSPALAVFREVWVWDNKELRQFSHSGP